MKKSDFHEGKADFQEENADFLAEKADDFLEEEEPSDEGSSCNVESTSDEEEEEQEDRKAGNYIGVREERLGYHGERVGFRATYKHPSQKVVNRLFRSERLAAVWRDREALKAHKKKTKIKQRQHHVRLNFPNSTVQTWS